MPDASSQAGTFTVNADIGPVATALKSLEDLSKSFGSQLTGSLKSAVVSGKDLEGVLRSLGSSLSRMALAQGLKPLQSLTGSAFAGIFQGLQSLVPFAKGGVPGHVTPFAGGGVVSTPSYFPMTGNVGLMGEAGPEAIMPLQRGADGRLGVAASGAGAPVSIVFNVTAQDAASFRKSEAQITGMLARAVSRGARTF